MSIFGFNFEKFIELQSKGKCIRLDKDNKKSKLFSSKEKIKNKRLTRRILK